MPPDPHRKRGLRPPKYSQPPTIIWADAYFKSYWKPCWCTRTCIAIYVIFTCKKTIAHLYTWRSWNHPSLQRLKHWWTPSWNKPEITNRNKDQNLLTAQHKQQTIQPFSYLISPSFLAVADPTFFAAVAVLDPASLNIVFVAVAPVLSLLYLKTQMDQTH